MSELMNLNIIDTHAHYDDDAFDEDRDVLLRSLPEQGIVRAVNMGASLRGAAESLALAEGYPHIYAGIGIHPDHVGVLERGTELSRHGFAEDTETVDSGTENDSSGLRSDLPADLTEDLNGDEVMEYLKRLCDSPKVVTYGEIGLDYHWDVEPRDIQKKWFAAQMRLSVELDLPINVHSREAAQDTFDLIKSEHAGTTGGIIHCYSGSAEMAREYVKMGYYIGIGGVVTFKNARTQKKVVEEIPLEYLVTETDAPYMAPTPHRGKRNSSLYIPLVIEEIARIKGMSVEDTAAVLYENALRVYRWER